MNKLKLCTLSGTEEVGRNCSFVEYKGQILIIDMGFTFPEVDSFGIDYLIPNFSYLKKNKSKIVGVVITHGHLDHTGAIPYILPELDFPPVYTGKFANALIKNRLKEFKLEKKVKTIDVLKSKKFSLGNFDITFVGVTHSIPDSHSIFVETRAGNMLFSGDYKIDKSPANEPETDYEKFKEIGKKTDIALMESTNSFEVGKCLPESEVRENIEDVIKKAKGRVVVASFSSLVSRIHSVFTIAQKTNRKVVLLGRSINDVVRIAREQGYINVPDNILVSEKNLKKFQDNQLLFVSTGSQGERHAALNRISLNEHKWFKAKKGDLIILSASEIPGNTIKISAMTDRLIKLGADILKANMQEIYESGHGHQEDMKIMYEMLEPKYIIPVHGNMTMRYKNKQNLVKWGFPEERVELTEDGQIWEYSNGKLSRGLRIESKPVLIDGLGFGAPGDIVIKDRKQLAKYGVFTILINLSSKEKRMLGKPKFLSRGFVYMKASHKLLQEVESITIEEHKRWLKESRKNLQTRVLKENIEKRIKKFLYKKTEREPVIMIAII